MTKQGFIDKAIDKLFSINKTTLVMVLLLIIGFALRVLFALRRQFSADEMVHGVHAIGFISSKKLQIMDQSAVWFWLSDFFMKILGTGVLGIRFTSILFGSLSIVVIFLITKELFNKQTAIFAAIFATFSAYLLNFMEAGMDTTMTFFVLIGLYFFVISLNQNKKFWFYLSWVALGIAVMVKPIALIFLGSFLLCSFYYHFYKYKTIKIKDYLFVGILLLILFTPVLTFNYLLYKDKGILDLQFARFTRISIETYGSIAPTIESFDIMSLFFSETENSKPGLATSLMFIYHFESPIILIFALIGLFYMFTEKNKFLPLLIVSFLLTFIFLSGTSLLPNHFVFVSFYLIIFSSKGLEQILKLFKNENYKKYFIIVVFLALIISSFYYLNTRGASQGSGIFSEVNELEQVIDFKNSDIGDKSLVIADSRIYRGRSVFMFWDRNFLEGSLFLNFLSQQESISDDFINVDTYFLECVRDDCGWGGGKISPELNDSMEMLVDVFKTQAILVKEIKSPKGEDYFKIYKQTLKLKPQIFYYTDISRDWFYYPIAYKPYYKTFDNYQTHNFVDEALDKIAYLILISEVILALILTIFIVYLLSKNG
jgi:4-amino-4-deoxy-L-arabinose transferase-like glycosyltransferase